MFLSYAHPAKFFRHLSFRSPFALLIATRLVGTLASCAAAHVAVVKRNRPTMVAGMRLRRLLAVAVLALVVMAAAICPDGLAQGGATTINKVATATFSYLPNGTAMPALYQVAGMTFFAHSSSGTGGPRIVDQGTPSERGYGFPAAGVTVVLPAAAKVVEARACLFAGAVTIETLSATGTRVAQKVVRLTNKCGDVSLAGADISIVRFTGGGGEASIVRLSARASRPPVVNAGADQSVTPGEVVILPGAARDPGGAVASHAWKQTGGKAVLLAGADRAIALFVAPDVSADETLTFRLTATDDEGEIATDDVTVTVVAQVDSFISVGAGVDHTCAVLDTGAMECWGRNDYGQSVPPAGPFVSVSAGESHTCGVRDTGVVECWGSNWRGRATPPVGMGTFVSVSAAGGHTCAVGDAGAVTCWGLNHVGQSVPPAGPFVSVSAGGNHTCAVRDTGALKCWGNDGYHQTPPTGTFRSVSVGGYHACGVRTTGAVECWGRGQATPPTGTFSSVSAGSVHTCGVRTTGAVACWGSSDHGRTVPPEGTFVSVDTVGSHTCGVRDTGAVECWGNNSHGKTVPPTPTGTFVSVSAGREHTCAMRDTGAVDCWGHDDNGDLDPPMPTGMFVSLRTVTQIRLPYYVFYVLLLQ